jgi:immune inhibitor A
MVDDIEVTGYPVDGAETDGGWTFVPATGGFRVTGGTESALFSHYYVAEPRQYRGYDSTLKVGPYNFGFLDDPMLGNFVEHFPYQDGMLVSYWDTSQGDNNVSAHPGEGTLLPIDAHPAAMVRPDGVVWRARVQTFDATLSLEKTDAIALHNMSVPYNFASQAAVRAFDDRLSYYDDDAPYNSVITPVTGTQLRIVGYSAQGGFLQLNVSPVK